MSITLIDILNKRKMMQQIEQEEGESAESTAYIPDAIEELEAKQAEARIRKEEARTAEETEKVIKNMKRYEKEAAARGIPTDILQNEISRRMERDHKALKEIKGIINTLEAS